MSIEPSQKSSNFANNTIEKELSQPTKVTEGTANFGQDTFGANELKNYYKTQGNSAGPKQVGTNKQSDQRVPPHRLPGNVICL